MNQLIQRLGRAVKAVLTGFDRIVFKGLIRPLAYADGAMAFCRGQGILFKDYKQWMMGQTHALVDAVDQYARRECGQGIVPLKTWRADKDQLAKSRQQAEGIDTGPIGVWSCVESGRSYRARYCAERGYPQLRHYPASCKHLYLYFDHKQYGWMNVRIQTWFPYPIQICMNGREWLRRGLEADGVEFVRRGNKFFQVEDYAHAQRVLDRQLDTRWPRLLGGFLPVAFPTLREALGPHLRYHWTLWQSEWATDLIFESPADLSSTMDALLRHAFMTGTSTRVLRYLDRPVTLEGQPYRNLNNEVTSRVLDFQEGLRVRHWVESNSVKAYNEQNALRIETTINKPGMFQVWRRAEGESPDAPKKRRPLRKGVADVPLRAQVSEEINNRFMEGLSTFSDQTPLRELLRQYTRARTRGGRRIRALDPTGKDRELLEAVGDPLFTVSGMTNASLRQRLKSTAWGAGRTDQQLSARITRHLRLLRDHGLIRKVPSRRRYHLTPKGAQFTTALSAALAASTQQLMEIAA
jgi:hypothetical protein